MTTQLNPLEGVSERGLEAIARVIAQDAVLRGETDQATADQVIGDLFAPDPLGEDTAAADGVFPGDSMLGVVDGQVVTISPDKPQLTPHQVIALEDVGICETDAYSLWGADDSFAGRYIDYLLEVVRPLEAAGYITCQVQGVMTWIEITDAGRNELSQRQSTPNPQAAAMVEGKVMPFRCEHCCGIGSVEQGNDFINCPYCGTDDDEATMTLNPEPRPCPHCGMNAEYVGMDDSGDLHPETCPVWECATCGTFDDRDSQLPDLVMRFKKRLLEVKEDLGEANEQVADLTFKGIDLERERDELKAQVAELQSQIDRQLNTILEERAIYEGKIARLEADPNAEQTALRESLYHQIGELETQVKIADGRLNLANEKIARLEAAQTADHRELDRVEGEREALRLAIQTPYLEVFGLRIMNTDSLDAPKVMADEIRRLRAEVETLKGGAA